LAPGSNDVNLNDTTMQWITSDGSYQLVSDRIDDPSAASGDGYFNWTMFRDNDESIDTDSTLNDPVDRATLQIDLSNGLEPLDAGTSVETQIDTRSGGQTTVTLVVPDSLSNKDSVQL